MNENIIQNALEYAKKVFENEGSGHDFWHTLRVYNLATTICKKEDADLFVVQLTALLHDVDDIKIFGGEMGQYTNAKKFMESEGLSNEVISRVCDIISKMSFKGKEIDLIDTIEGKIVQDADRLDGIGAIGIARVFTYGGHISREIHNPDIKALENMSKEEYIKNKGTSINHFYEKLFKLKDLMNTNEAKKIAESRHEYLMQYLDRFYKEWNGEL